MKYNFFVDLAVKITIGVLAIVAIVLQIESNDKIVYVDSQKLVTGYKGAQVARQEFESKSAVWKSNLDTLRSEVEARIADYESKKSKLSPKEQALTEELLSAKQREYLNYEQAIQEKVRAEDQALTQRVFGEVNKFLEKYGKNKGYKIIMAATQAGNIVYADDKLDVTAEVMEGLNAEYK